MTCLLPPTTHDRFRRFDHRIGGGRCGEERVRADLSCEKGADGDLRLNGETDEVRQLTRACSSDHLSTENNP